MMIQAKCAVLAGFQTLLGGSSVSPTVVTNEIYILLIVIGKNRVIGFGF